MVPFITNTRSIKIVPEPSKSNASFAPIVSPDDSMTLQDTLHNKTSPPVPITKGLRRTPSEIQLCEDLALAEHRDYCMFTRIVSGIQRRQSEQQDMYCLYENDACLANIHRTRCGAAEDSRSLESRHQSLLDVLGNPSLKTSHDFLTEAQSVVASSNYDTILNKQEDDDEDIFVMDL